MTDDERRRRARKLRRLRLNRIDLVPSGANPLASISFFKHDTTGEVAELKRRIAKAERQTEKLKRVDEPESAGWYSQLEDLARERVAKTKLTPAQARVEVFHQHPELQAARDAEGRRKYERPDLQRPDKVAVFLAKKRRELGLSQEAVAKSADISQAALSKLESGDTETPTLRTFSRLYSALGLTLEDVQKAGIFR